MSENNKHRLVSGERVVCKCSLDLPKLDPFATQTTRRKGYMVLNVRGGSFYSMEQFPKQNLARMFPENQRALLRNFTVYAEDNTAISLGDINVRFLKQIISPTMAGLVFKFVHITEKQLDLLNELVVQFPVAAKDEETSIPVYELRRL